MLRWYGAVEDIHDVTLGRTVIGDRARITYHAVVLSGVEVGADATQDRLA